MLCRVIAPFRYQHKRYKSGQILEFEEVLVERFVKNRRVERVCPHCHMPLPKFQREIMRDKYGMDYVIAKDPLLG